MQDRHEDGVHISPTLGRVPQKGQLLEDEKALVDRVVTQMVELPIKCSLCCFDIAAFLSSRSCLELS